MSYTQTKLTWLGALLLGLTACIGDEAGTVHYYRWGVVEEQPMRSIHTVDGQGNHLRISSADFENQTEWKQGDCCAVEFKTNWVKTLVDGVYQADILRYDTISVWPVHNQLTDTSAVLPNERFVTPHFGRSCYMADRFFIEVQDAYHQADQQDLFDLSYDSEQTAEVDSAGRHIYNLFLRVRSLPGTGDSTKWVQTNAFRIDDFLQTVRPTEEALGDTEVRFSVNYPTGFEADSIALVWGKSSVFTLRFSE